MQGRWECVGEVHGGGTVGYGRRECVWVGGRILCNRQCLVWFVPAQPTMSTLVATVMKMKYFATTYDCTRE